MSLAAGFAQAGQRLQSTMNGKDDFLATRDQNLSMAATNGSPHSELPQTATLWIPIAGFLYALCCPLSDKYNHPFHHLLPYYWYLHGTVGRFLTGDGFFAGTAFLRLLFLTLFAAAFFIRALPDRTLRWRAVVAGVYWPLLISTVILVANSGYAIIWSWILVPTHVFVAIAALVVVNRAGPHLGRWIWLGVISGFGVWALSVWL